MASGFEPDSRIDKTFPPLTIRKLNKEDIPTDWKTLSDDEKLRSLKRFIPEKYHEKVAYKTINDSINKSLDKFQKYYLSVFTYINISYTDLLKQVDTFSHEIPKEILSEQTHETGDIESSEFTEELLQSINDRLDNRVLWKRDVDVVLVFFTMVNGDPEMFILTSGNARHLIPDEKVDENFPHKVARRILDFSLKSSSFGHLTGPDQSSSRTYKLGEVKDLPLWDVIGSVVTSFQMPLRRNCSLYDIDNLKKRKDEEITVNVNIGGHFKTLRIEKKLSLFDLQEILHRFSKISRGESTSLTTGAEEKDNEMFDVFDNIQVVKLSTQCQKLNQEVFDSLKNNDVSSFTLSHRFTSTWNDASIFKLKHKAEPRHYEDIEQWEGSPPNLQDVMDAKQGSLSAKASPFNDIFLEFICTVRESGIEMYRFPLFDFIEGQVDFKGKRYFRYQGKWLEIKCQYLKKVEEKVRNLLTEHYIPPDEILPLPWRDTPDLLAKVESSKQWKLKVQSILDTSEGNKREEEGIVDFKDFSPPDFIIRIIERMHCWQKEKEYNEGYILLNHTLPSNADGQPTGYLLGDRILVRDIELFDILYYTPTEVYLIHVKEGFGHTSRDVCSQIRLSADLVFSEIITNSDSGMDILEQYWTSATTETSEYTKANKNLYEKMTRDKFFDLFQGRRDIIYILAFRDTHKRSRLDEYSDLFPEALFLKEDTFRDIESIKTLLVNTGYIVQQEGQNFPYITNKIFMAECEAVDQMTDAIPMPILDREQAKRAFTLLRHTVCQPPSVITKMELVNLFYHFTKFQITGKKVQLKICNLNKVLAWE